MSEVSERVAKALADHQQRPHSWSFADGSRGPKCHCGRKWSREHVAGEVLGALTQPDVIEAALALHVRGGMPEHHKRANPQHDYRDWCRTCWNGRGFAEWPCPTVRALTGGGDQ